MNKYFLPLLFCTSLHAYAASPLEPLSISAQITTPRTVIVNIPQRKIFFYEYDKLVESYDSGVGKPGSQTPLGTWQLSQKRPNPAWYVPASIKGESARKGRSLPSVVPPGKNNPLGEYFMKVGDTSIGIHGTNNPASVPGWVSHGCIRLNNKDAITLAKHVEIGDTVHIVYERIILATDQDDIQMQILPDPYHKSAKIDRETVLSVLANAKIDASRVDMTVVDTLLRNKSGEITSIAAHSYATNKMGVDPVKDPERSESALQ